MVTNRYRKSFGSRRKNSKFCLHGWPCWSFWSAFGHFRTHFVKSFCMSKSSWMMDPTRSREMPSSSAIDSAEIRRSSKISSWMWTRNGGVVTVLGRPGRGASQVVKSPRSNWTTQFWQWHKMVNVPLMFPWEWREFPSAPCLAEKKKTWWQLTSRCCWNRARRLTCFLSASVTTKDFAIRHMNTPLFPTTLSIPSYDIGT